MPPASPDPRAHFTAGLLVFLGTLIFISIAVVLLSEPRSRSVAFTVVDAGEQSAITEKRNFVIRSIEEWADLWARLHGEGLQPPAVDFSNTTVLAIFQGPKPSQEFGVEVKSVERSSVAVEVSVIERVPGAGCERDRSTVLPYQILLVRTRSEPIVSNVQEREITCER